MKRFGTSEQQLHVEVHPQEKLHPQFRTSTVTIPFRQQHDLLNGTTTYNTVLYPIIRYNNLLDSTIIY